MATISTQQGKEAAGAAYAAAGTSIAGQKSALALSNHSPRVEFSGRMAGAEITLRHVRQVQSFPKP